MSISEKQRSDILRYYFVEHWRVGTIATELGLHHSSVERIISRAGMPKVERARRPSIIDPYLPFIHATLEQHPKLTAARLYQMAQSRGYTGGPSHFRQWVAQLRPRAVPEAFLRVQTLPGEQAQVDWGHFGHLQIGRAKRPLMAFVMVLSDSRAVFLRFFHNARMASFLQGHVEAFSALGIARVLLYDNLKSAVLHRHGTAVEYHPELLSISAHYRFEPRAVAVARGNEKGRVERAIRYIRDNFFAARDFEDIVDLNAQADHWCKHIASQRRCPGHPDITIAQAFSAEQPTLGALPDQPYICDDRVVVTVRKTPYVRYDLNDYSVPHRYVRQPLTVLADPMTVRVLDGEQEVARHRRCYDKGSTIEHAAHLQALREAKGQARADNTQHRLAQAVPASEVLLQHAAALGYSLAQSLRQLNLWLDQYGASELQLAIEEALSQSRYHVNSVLLVLERRRELQNKPAPLVMALSDKARDHPTITPASLKRYDQLQSAFESDDLSNNSKSNNNGNANDD